MMTTVEEQSRDVALPAEVPEQIAEGLGKLLADTFVLSLKTQNFHWNVTGPQFHSLHVMFEQQYAELNTAADEIAERIRALGFPAPGTFAAFARLACVPEQVGVPRAQEMIRLLIADQETVVRTARALIPVVERAGDVATGDLLARRIQMHEKTAWMLRSQLN